MERRSLTGRYALALTLLMLAAGWVQSLGQASDPSVAPVLNAVPIAKIGGSFGEQAGRLMIALLFPASLIGLVLLCERNPGWAGRLLRARSWACFVLAFPYFFLLVLCGGIAAELVLITPISKPLMPLANFAAANSPLLWSLFFALLALFCLPPLERWLLNRYR